MDTDIRRFIARKFMRTTLNPLNAATKWRLLLYRGFLNKNCFFTASSNKQSKSPTLHLWMKPRTSKKKLPDVRRPVN